jgi:hypothetical protein
MTQTSFKVGGSGVPAGSYNVKFEGLEEYSENSDKFGEGCLLKFEVLSGDQKGNQTTRIVSKKFSTKSNLYRFAKALLGRELTRGEDFDFADFVGTKGLAIVEETESGATRVATFLRAAE